MSVVFNPGQTIGQGDLDVFLTNAGGFPAKEEARSRLGSDPDPSAVLEFLNLTAHRIEDVKGWWGDNHPTYPKVSSFRSQHPGTFNVVVKTKGVWSCL